MEQKKPKHTIIVDANLHIQDPHEIILSYFNTANDTQFVAGSKKSFANKVLGTFVALMFFKFFFQELFTGLFFFILSAIAMVVLGLIFSRGLILFTGLLSRSARSDSLRGILYQFVFMTLIVIALGLFV